jgi:hypothetical protein
MRTDLYKLASNFKLPQMNFISDEKKNSIHSRINALYEMCGNLSPIVYFIDGLTNQFNSIVDNDCQAFESHLAEAENKMQVYYNREGVTREVAESAAFNHLLVYKVQETKGDEGRYFFHMELANLFIRAAVKRADFKYFLNKIYNGYSVGVSSPIFFV